MPPSSRPSSELGVIASPSRPAGAGANSSTTSETFPWAAAEKTSAAVAQLADALILVDEAELGRAVPADAADADVVEDPVVPLRSRFFTTDGSAESLPASPSMYGTRVVDLAVMWSRSRLRMPSTVGGSYSRSSR